MIYLTQLIYIAAGREDTFHRFEDVAIPLIAKHNGRMLLRIRPGDNEPIELDIEKPYEIHLVSFPTDEDFERFSHDEERQRFLHLKEESVRSVLLIRGQKI